MKSLVSTVLLGALLSLSATLFAGTAAQAAPYSTGDRLTPDLQSNCGSHGDHGDHATSSRRSRSR